MLFVASGPIVTSASTNRFVAGPLPPGPWVPEVERVTFVEGGAAFASESTKCQVALAFAVNRSATLLLIVTVQVRVFPLPPHWLESPQVDDIDWGAGEIVGVIDVSDAVVPESNAVVVMVNLGEWLTSFTALDAMLMFASTNRFVTEPELPCVPSVERLTVCVAGLAPASVSSNFQDTSAVAVITAAELLLTWKVQVRVLPLPPQFAELAQWLFNSVTDGLVCGVIDSRVAVVPDGIPVVETVNVCAVPTSFTPFGVMLTFASTNRFVTSPELPVFPS